MLTTAELTITLQPCCHRLPGFLSSMLVMFPWPQPLLSRVWGFFGLGSQACQMKEFALWGRFQKACPQKPTWWMYKGFVQGERGGESKWRTAVPPVAEPAGLPRCCPAQGLTCTVEGSSPRQIDLFGELPEVLRWQGSRCPGAGHWDEASSFPLPGGAR